jgi:hypothetical protein
MPPRKKAEGADQTAAKATATPAGKPVLRRRRPRRSNRPAPEAGWSLVGDAAGRLGLWEGLRGYLAQRAFTLAIKKLVPRLAAHARAEQLLGDTLVVRVSSSAVATELSFVRDLLLTQVNEGLDAMSAQLRRGARRTPIRRLQHRVGAVAELPDALEWTGGRRKPRSRPKAPPPQVDAGVAQALGQVQDDALRRALSAMYAASLQREPA